MPEGDVSTEGFIVIREALTSTRKGRARQVDNAAGGVELRRRHALRQRAGSQTLRYQNELRAADPNFADIPDLKIDKEMIELATELIRRKSRPFDPAQFSDAYAEALKQLVVRKRAGHTIVTTGEEERREPGKIINLIEALKKSVGQAALRRAPTDAAGRGGAKNASEPRGSAPFEVDGSGRQDKPREKARINDAAT